jgi:transposase
VAHDHPTGVDHLKACNHTVVQDTSGKTVRSGSARNDGRTVARFPAPYSESTRAAMEAARDSTVVFDWAEEFCDEVVPAPPPKVKAIADPRIKIDATILAQPAVGGAGTR